MGVNELEGESEIFSFGVERMFFQRLYLKFAIIHFVITSRIYFCNRLRRIQKGPTLFVNVTVELEEGK